MSRPRTCAIALALGLGFTSRGAPAQTATLVGRVTSALTGAPVRTAQVTLTGTGLAALVDGDGRFRIANVPVTAHEARVRGLGFTPVTIAIALSANTTDTVAITMTASAIALDAVFVTGSAGDRRRRAIGNSVAEVLAPDIVARSAVTNITELLQGKAPGLTLMPGSGVVGSAANFRLRGSGSLSVSNSPTIYIDGIRVSTRSQGNYAERFGQSTTALDAINPADIESIEIIKGPAAATLYGAEAAAGVIQILTKSGRPGRVSWEVRVDAAQSDWAEGRRPMNFAIATPGRLDSLTSWPGFAGKSVGDIISVRPMSDGRALRTAGMSKLALSARGGGEHFTYFVSAGSAREEGVQYNNFSNLNTLRGNFSITPSPAVRFTTNVNVSRSHIRFPLNDNAGPIGLLSSAYLAIPGRGYTTPGGLNYATITPEITNGYDDQSRADRFIISASADYAPVAWFRNTFLAGLDANVGSVELYFAPDPLGTRPILSRGSLALDNSKGLIAQGRPLNRDVTLNYDATVTRRLSGNLVGNTSFGVQYLANSFGRTDAVGTDLGSADLRSISSAAVTSSSDTSSQQKSLGFYLQQQLALRDRLFLIVATRVDNNSAFGSRLHHVFYPKASVSYVISDEPFFRVPGVSVLRLRAAWGQAGNSPGPYDAARSYTTSVVTNANGTTSALRYGAPGNPNLRPERGAEIEAGFESALAGGRVALDATAYRKTTHDALMPVALAPSSGFTGMQLVNLGSIANMGIEMMLTATPVKRQSVTVDAIISFAANRNRLVSFGDDRQPVIFGSNGPTQRHQPGYPLGAMWAQTVMRNDDGTLRKVDGRPVLDTASIYTGSSVPVRELSLSMSMLLFRRVRLHTLLDHKGGHYQLNELERRRDRAGLSWATVDPAADPDEVLVRRFESQTFGYIQPADFVKLRDLSVSYDLPRRVIRHMAQRATITLAGRNLKTWTRYGGDDPELNYGGARTFNRDDLWTVPQTRRFSTSLAFTF